MCKKHFKKILEEQAIWAMDDIPDGDFKEGIKKLQVTCYRIQIFYRWFSLASFCTFYIPVALGQREVIFGTSFCSKGIWRYWRIILQTLMIFECVVTVPAVDLVFVGGCVHLAIQLKITEYVITNMNYERTKFKTLVDNYCNLFRYVKTNLCGILNSGLFQVCRRHESGVPSYSLYKVLFGNNTPLCVFVPASVPSVARFSGKLSLLLVSVPLLLDTYAGVSLLQRSAIRIDSRNFPLSQILQDVDSVIFRLTQ